MNAKLTLSGLSWGLFAGVIILSGCVSAPKEELRITQLDSNQLGLSHVASPRAAEGWWKVFGDAQLNQLIDDALSNSPSLGEALIRVRGAQAAPG